jgi:hypothetical protein
LRRSWCRSDEFCIALSSTSVLPAAPIVAIALAFGAARADAAPAQLRNAQTGQMMEVLGDTCCR